MGFDVELFVDKSLAEEYICVVCQSVASDVHGMYVYVCIHDCMIYII